MTAKTTRLIAAVASLMCTMSCVDGGGPIHQFDTGPDAGLALDAVEDGTGDNITPGDDAAPDEDGGGPADCGLDAETDLPPAFPEPLAHALQSLLEEQAAFSADPGVTLTVWLPDGTSFSGAAGVSNLATGAPMRPNSAFRVGSNTKPVVAVTVLRLVEDGLIDLDAPLTMYLPEYTEWTDITVRMLLNMRSGLKDFLRIPALMVMLIVGNEAVAPEDIISEVRKTEPDFPPNTSGAYSNTGYLLLGMIIEEVTGLPADQTIDQVVLQPLGMTDTYLDVGARENDRLTEGYIDFAVAALMLSLDPSVEALLPAPEYFDGLLLGTRLIHPTVTWTAGALVSTSKDMATLVHALMAGDFLEPDTLAQMTDPEVAELFNGPVKYGLGIQVRDTPHGTVYGHGGLNIGYQAATYFYPDHGVTLSHLHNFLYDLVEPFQTEVMDQVLAGGDINQQPCLPPDGLFRAFDTGRYLNVAFKGEVNASDTDDDDFSLGTATWRLVGPDGPKPFVGLLPSAVVWPATTGGGALTITSYGNSDLPGVDLVSTTLTATESLFQGMLGDGRKTIGPQNLGDLTLVVSHGTLREGTTFVFERFCTVAISDYRGLRTGDVYVGGSEGTLPEPGDTVRLYASLPFLDDPPLVTAALEWLNAPVCWCLAEDESYQPCPEEPETNP